MKLFVKEKNPEVKKSRYTVHLKQADCNDLAIFT
jgi:hypothetical protein